MTYLSWAPSVIYIWHFDKCCVSAATTTRCQKKLVWAKFGSSTGLWVWTYIFEIMIIWQNSNSNLLPRANDLSKSWDFDQVYSISHKNPPCRTGLISHQKAVGWLHNLNGTITIVDTSCQPVNIVAYVFPCWVRLLMTFFSSSVHYNSWHYIN